MVARPEDYDDKIDLIKSPATGAEVAAFAADLAREMEAMCGRAGLIGLAALFAAARREAESARGRAPEEFKTIRSA